MKMTASASNKLAGRGKINAVTTKRKALGTKTDASGKMKSAKAKGKS